MDVNKLTKILTLYIFLSDYHSGQNSRGYRILSRIVRKYDPNVGKFARVEIRKSESYNYLVEKYGRKV